MMIGIQADRVAKFLGRQHLFFERPHLRPSRTQIHHQKLSQFPIRFAPGNSCHHYLTTRCLDFLWRHSGLATSLIDLVQTGTKCEVEILKGDLKIDSRFNKFEPSFRGCRKDRMPSLDRSIFQQTFIYSSERCLYEVADHLTYVFGVRLVINLNQFTDFTCIDLQPVKEIYFILKSFRQIYHRLPCRCRCLTKHLLQLPACGNNCDYRRAERDNRADESLISVDPKLEAIRPEHSAAIRFWNNKLQLLVSEQIVRNGTHLAREKQLARKDSEADQAQKRDRAPDMIGPNRLSGVHECLRLPHGVCRHRTARPGFYPDLALDSQAAASQRPADHSPILADLRAAA